MFIVGQKNPKDILNLDIWTQQINGSKLLLFVINQLFPPSYILKSQNSS